MPEHMDGVFANISSSSLQKMQVCFDMVVRSYRPGERIAVFEEDSNSVGILLAGTVMIVRVQSDGMQTLMEYLGPGEVFGAAFLFYTVNPESYIVYCKEAARIQFFDFRHVFTPCSRACACHSQLIENFLRMLSRKTALLNERIEILSQRSIRDKLKSYFHIMSVKSDSDTFSLPFTLSALSEYLCVDRSAMMRELKKLKEEGILEVQRHKVRVLQPAALLD